MKHPVPMNSVFLIVVDSVIPLTAAASLGQSNLAQDHDPRTAPAATRLEKRSGL
jgi:hypothetical protein